MSCQTLQKIQAVLQSRNQLEELESGSDSLDSKADGGLTDKDDDGFYTTSYEELP
jgi:hypothetical protein